MIRRCSNRRLIIEWLLLEGRESDRLTARLFRQPAIGDWPNVVDQVAAALRQLKQLL
jgi:hypothetical protein